jgi:ribosomal protein S18 acetylase RimI-like enzyme
MPRLAITSFGEEHLDEAARLLARRHAHHRVVEPLLPERFEEPAAAREELERVWRSDGASGAAALRGGRLVGYLIGVPRDPSWGENVWVELAGHAVEAPEDARDLYAEAAAAWVEQGRTSHYVLVRADEALADAWFRLGFGQQQAHGYREVPRSTEVRLPERCEIRNPTEEDLEGLLQVDLSGLRHQQASPVFSKWPLPTEEHLRQEWEKRLAGTRDQVLICLRDGRPVACWGIVPAQHSLHHRGIGLPERACYLLFAATLPEARGLGVGGALMEASLAWAAERYRAMITDWRVTNLLASRFWPRRGFRVSVRRLFRLIP